MLAAALVAISAAIAGQANVAATSSLNQAESARQQLNIDLLAAAAGGYTDRDLAPILDRRQELVSVAPPRGAGDRAVFFNARADGLAGLRLALPSLQAHQLDLLQRATRTRLDDLQNEIDQDEKMGVDPVDLQPLRSRAQVVADMLATAHGPIDFRRAFDAMGVPIEQAAQLRLGRAADLAAVQAEADRLKAATGGSLDALRTIGAQALAEGRNLAAAEAYLRLNPGRRYALLESNAARFGGTSVEDVALAVALEERYRDEIHSGLLASLPRKLILISITASELWAYQDQTLYVHTLVTTGRPELPTDRGLMMIARKQSPVHFISPFPKGSPYDYGTIDARYALFFQPSGEAIHDSWWRSWYGPGSNIGEHGSHGCVGVPYGPIDLLYPWADVGTPVLVIPGDGTTVANQLVEKTYDDPFWGEGPITI